MPNRDEVTSPDVYKNPPLSALDGYLCAARPLSLISVAITIGFGIAAADYLTGYDLSLASLYLLPIFVVAWPLGPHAAVVMAIICAVAWFMSVLFMQPSNVSPLLQFWDGAIQLAIFVLFGLLIAKLRIALARADDRFATVLERLDAAIHVSDAKTGELLYANRRFYVDFPDDDSRSALDAARDQAEYYDSKNSRWYLVEWRPLTWVDGRSALLQLAADISDKKRTDALFRAQQEKIQVTARLAMAGELATTIAHELNQPLGAIRNYIVGCIRFLRSRNCDDDEVLGALEKAVAQAERAGAVIHRLRSMVARRPTQAGPCDINAVISGVSSMIEAEAQERGIEMVVQLSPRIPKAPIDQILVEQVLLNLARNAIDAMETTPTGERKMQLRSGQLADGRIVVEVQDNGCGFNAELEKNLFTPFFSTKAHGTGLGLHICRSIIEAHGGHMTIRRAEDGGSIFAFSLSAISA